MKRLIRFLHLLKRDEKGNVLIIVAAALIVLMGMTALVVDVGQLYSARRQMVNAADGAALAGSLEAKSNTKFARQVAKQYALYNGASTIFDEDLDVYFTGDDEFRIISVRVFSNEVEYTFARVLGFDSSIVPAIASAQVGPGNPLVPFVDLGWECDECEGEGKVCACDECGAVCEGEECGGDCEVDDCEGFCQLKVCDKCGGLGYFIRTVEYDNPDDPIPYKPAEPGDHYEIKYERWQSWLGSTAGNFPYIRLPGQTGAQDLYENLAGGYTGDLEDVAIGTIHPAQTGNIAGKLREAMFTRMTIHGEPYCSYDGFKCESWYKCDLVVVIPIVIKASTGPKDFEVVGYASLLLDGNKYTGEKNVWVYFLEYLTYEKLQYLLTENLDGFVTRLVQDPEEALNFFKSSR